MSSSDQTGALVSGNKSWKKIAYDSCSLRDCSTNPVRLSISPNRTIKPPFFPATAEESYGGRLNNNAAAACASAPVIAGGLVLVAIAVATRTDPSVSRSGG